MVAQASRQRSLERAARWQGIFPAVLGGQGDSALTPKALVDIVDRVRALRSDLGLAWEGYDVVVEADTFGKFGDIHGSPEPWVEAGATWWIESWWDLPEGSDGVTELRRRVQAGPHRA